MKTFGQTGCSTGHHPKPLPSLIGIPLIGREDQKGLVFPYTLEEPLSHQEHADRLVSSHISSS